MLKVSSANKKDRSKGQRGKPSSDNLKVRRKAQAKSYIEKEQSKGRLPSSLDDIHDILRKYQEKYALEEDHFDCLDKDDLFNLTLEAINSQRKSPTQAETPGKAPNTKTQYGQSTPGTSRGTSDCDDLSEVQDEHAEDDNSARSGDLPIIPIDAAEESIFEIVLFCSHRQAWEIVRASRCRNKRSYISRQKVELYNLKPDRTQDESIRLSWKEQDPAKKTRKIKSTRFWFIDNDQIEDDVAFGTDCDEPDDLDHEDGAEEDGPEDDEPGVESEEGSACDDSSTDDDALSGEGNSEAMSSEEESNNDGDGTATEEIEQSSEGSYVAITKRTRHSSSATRSEMAPAKQKRLREVSEILRGYVDNPELEADAEEEDEVVTATKVERRTKSGPASTHKNRLTKKSTKRTAPSSSKAPIASPKKPSTTSEQSSAGKRTSKETASPARRRAGTTPSDTAKGAVHMKHLRRWRTDGTG